MSKTVDALTVATRTLWGATGISLASTGIDLGGISALVTSITGLVAAVGAVYLAAKKRSSDSTEKALELLLRLEQDRMRQQQDDYEEMLRVAKARKQHKRINPRDESD